MNKGRNYSQLSISSVQFCSSRGYLLRSIMQAAVVVILETHDTVTSSIHGVVVGFNRQQIGCLLFYNNKLRRLVQQMQTKVMT